MSEDQDVQDFYDCRMIKRGVNRRVVIASWEIALLLPRPCKGMGPRLKGAGVFRGVQPLQLIQMTVSNDGIPVMFQSLRVCCGL